MAERARPPNRGIFRNLRIHGTVANYDNLIISGTICHPPGRLTRLLQRSTNHSRRYQRAVSDAQGRPTPLNAGRGWYQDTLDVGLDVGRDLSDVIRLEDGQNIESVTRSDAADEFATWVNVQPQSDDEKANGFIAVDIPAIQTYGIVRHGDHG
ncbi:hypothetical protein CCP3SC15_2610005 [Gammaproteobacteria bacterium]